MNNTKDEQKLIDIYDKLIDDIIDIINSYKEFLSQISQLTNERIKLLDINEHQEKDDIMFYTSIFDDTIFYLRKSLKIRKKKLKRDIITNIKYINTNISDQLDVDFINKNECKNYFMKYMTEKNKNKYKWVKNDRLKELSEWLKNFTNIIEYHKYIKEYLEKIIKINIEFFENENDIEIEEDQQIIQQGITKGIEEAIKKGIDQAIKKGIEQQGIGLDEAIKKGIEQQGIGLDEAIKKGIEQQGIVIDEAIKKGIEQQGIGIDQGLAKEEINKEVDNEENSSE